MSRFKANYKSGIVLVSVLSVLTVVSLLSVYFLVTLKLQADKNALFMNDLRARLCARAGLHVAIAELKYGNDGARGNFCDSRLEAWYFKAGVGTALSDAEEINTSFANLTTTRTFPISTRLSGTMVLKIVDSASQVNINDTNPNLATMLSNLPGINATLAANIVMYRNGLPGGLFSYEEQIKNVSGMTDSLYVQVKDYITIESWSDPKATVAYDTNTFSTIISGDDAARSPVNVNTASREVLRAIMVPVVPADASFVADSIVTHVTTDPFYSWQEFDDFIDALGLDATSANRIKNNANPNRIKPIGYTTEFCFHGGGTYEIEVLASIERPNKSIVARKELKACVKLYDIMQHTLKEDFRDEDVNNDGDYSDSPIGEGNFDTNYEFGVPRLDNTNYMKVSWLDSCPTNEADDMTWQGYSGSDPAEISPFTYRAIPNAVKLGFWDNFDEDLATNQSRAWWGNEFNVPFEISDVGSRFNYTYLIGDFSDYYNEGVYMGGDPSQDRLHTFDEVSTGDNGFYLDDADNELWSPGSGPPLQDIRITDFSKYYLGTQGVGLGYINDPAMIDIAFRAWDAANGFYLRLFNYDGPRASIGTDYNFPGYLVSDGRPGRDRQDVGRVEFFGGNAQCYLHPIGNVYPGPATWGPEYQRYGPRFLAWCGLWSDVPGYQYQRDKVYKFVMRENNDRGYFYAYSNNFTHAHPQNGNFASNASGWINLYSNANQSAWDDVRLIDNEGRIAKHFVVPAEVDLGSFHCNAYVPVDGAAYFLGSSSGGTIQAGIADIDISLATEENNFVQSAGSYVPNVNLDTLGAGAQAIAGPSTSGATTFSYSIRLTTTIDSTTPSVPALEDVSVTYLPTTEILYICEQ